MNPYPLLVIVFASFAIEFICTPLSALETTDLHLEGEVQFSRINFLNNLSIPGVPDSPRSVDVTFYQSGDIKIKLDGQVENLIGYDGLKADLDAVPGKRNIYGRTCLITLTKNLEKLVLDNEALFIIEKKSGEIKYTTHGQSPGSAIEFCETISFYSKGLKIIIVNNDLYGPAADPFGSSDITELITTKNFIYYIQMKGMIDMLDAISAAVYPNYKKVVTRPDFRRLLFRE